MRVWRMYSERFDTPCIIPTYKFGCELVNVWVGFSYHGKLLLKRIEESFTNQKYMEIYESTFLPLATHIYGIIRCFVLQ